MGRIPWLVGFYGVASPLAAPTCNLIAGQSVERLAALSDGIFGAAMTLLVHVPAAEAIRSEHDLLRGLAALGPRIWGRAKSE